MAVTGLAELKKNLGDIYNKKTIALYALCVKYAAMCLKDFQQEQSGNKYWNNQTYQAMDLMVAEAFSEKDVIGFFMAHTVEYGPILELANNGRHEAIRPTINKFLPQFMEEVKIIWGQNG